jgi:3-deoxy-D-manno-octulosonate 8-phosphate phosphatase (KDO 8-P phosphatase)
MDLKKIKALVFDFDGVFTNNLVYVNQLGIESVSCSRSDGLGLDRVRELNIKTVIISTETNPVVKVRAEKLKIDCLQGISNKAQSVIEWAESNDVDLNEIAFLGNDINDIPALKIVGYPIGVNDLFDEVKPFIKMILSKKGGNGAVRELCDLIYFAHKNITNEQSF